MVTKKNGVKSRRRRSSIKLNEELPRALCFDDDDLLPARAGDLRSEDEVMEEFPPARVRQAGLTGASIPGGDVTADDLSPETLLDEHRSHSPSARDDRDALDTVLRDVDEGQIGAGYGADEAEELEEIWDEPIAPEELSRFSYGVQTASL